MIEITTSGNAAAGLRDLAARAKNPAAMLKEVGRRGANELKAWFRKRNQIPNKLGGRRSNLWLKIADSVQQPELLGANRARIAVTHPTIMQKVKGGRIEAKRGKYLTIPLVPEAYDRTVSVFKQETGIQLVFIKPRGGGGSGGVDRFLAQVLANGSLRVIYLLTPSVRQQPDPAALPPVAGWNAALLDQGQKHLARQGRSSTS